MEPLEKIFDISHISDIIVGLKKTEYPIDLGNGLYQVAPNCITTKRGIEEIEKEILEEIRNM